MAHHVLISDLPIPDLGLLVMAVEKLGFTHDGANTRDEAFRRLAEERFSIFFANTAVLSSSDLISISRKYPFVAVIAVGSRPVDGAEETLRHRVFDSLRVPLVEREVEEALIEAVEVFSVRRALREFDEVEGSYYNNFLQNFKWKDELRSRSRGVATHNVIRQMNIGLFQGSGFGALISAADLAMQLCEKKGDATCVPEDAFQLLRENAALASSFADSISAAQAIIQESVPYQEQAPAGELLRIIGVLKGEIGEALSLKKQILSIGSMPPLNPGATIVLREDRLKTALKELLINAMKYSEEGDTIIVLFLARHNYLEIKILNPAYPSEGGGSNGISGDREYLVFEPFFRMHSVVDDRYKGCEEFGYGLGLTIAKRIVNLHGASLWLYNLMGHLNERAREEVCATVRFPVLGGATKGQKEG